MGDHICRRMRGAWIALAALVAFASAEAGPGEEEKGQQLELDEAYKAHVSSILSAIAISEGKANVKYTDLNPQSVDIHTIAARIPALKVGMNALGHKMLHVHSDEGSKWSAEIMSSGATAGFSLTDRVKGLQKGDGKAGSQWTIYSAGKTFRVKDEAAGDSLQLKDGFMTLIGNKGVTAAKPRFTIVGGKDSVPRITLVSKHGDNAKHVSLYNRYGKFGIFSGTMDKSIFHVAADGSEVALVSANVQPHVTIESTAKGASAQELILKGHSQTVKVYHKSGTLGFCGMKKASKKCNSFYQATYDGQTTDFISQTDNTVVKLSHRLKGGNTDLHLVSQNKVGTLTSTNIYNADGTLGFRTKVGGANKNLLEIAPSGATKLHGTMQVDGTTHFKKEAQFDHNVNVNGVVTMQGKNVNAMFASMEMMARENSELKQNMDEMKDEAKQMQQRMTEMEQMTTAMKERMDTMMSTLQLMTQT